MKDYDTERNGVPMNIGDELNKLLDQYDPITPKPDFISRFWHKVDARETANPQPISLFEWLTLRRAAVFASAAVVLLAVILLLTIPSEPKLTGEEMDMVANLELLESIQDAQSIEILEHNGETEYLADIIELASAAD